MFNDHRAFLKSSMTCPAALDRVPFLSHYEKLTPGFTRSVPAVIHLPGHALCQEPRAEIPGNQTDTYFLSISL